MYKIVVLTILITIFSLSTIHAQFENANLGSDVSITITPTNPEPGQNITAEIKSYSIDINQSSIIWRYNGSVIASGVGKTRINTTAPSSNGAAILTATVSSAGSSPITTSVNIKSASIDLLWEAVDSYTPPFYKGKALLSRNGLIRATAIPNINSPKNLSFEWSRNGSVDLDISGYNRNSVVFKNETLKQQEDVSVNATNGLFSGTNSLSLVPSSPEIITYQKQEGFTDYSRGYREALSTSALGIVLRFEPYFFSIPKSIAANLSFSIKNEGTSIYGNPEPNEIDLSAPEIKGESNLDISINTIFYSLQNAARKFKILFN
jgi:hypothetical protein